MALAALVLATAALTPGLGSAETPLPPERLRDSGLEAFDGGRPLMAYQRLGQYLAREPQAADRPSVEAKLAAARAALLTTAVWRSQLVVTTDQQRSDEAAGGRSVARLAARDGRVTLEASAESRPQRAEWQRAGTIDTKAYLGLLGEVLDAPALRTHLPIQGFDPNLRGPRQAVTVRLAIGDESWEAQGLRGEAYERLSEVAASVFAFARAAAVTPEAGAASGERRP
jgi:hypothetical protein